MKVFYLVLSFHFITFFSSVSQASNFVAGASLVSFSQSTEDVGDFKFFNADVLKTPTANPFPGLPTVPIHDEDTILDFTRYEAVRQFINKSPYPKDELYTLFSKVKFQRKAFDLINPKPSIKSRKPSWCRYKKIHRLDKKASQGLEFWKKHQRVFQKVEAEGISDPMILLSTLGIETVFGEYTGNFPALDTLITLTFTDSRRRALFHRELKSLLMLFYETTWFEVDDVEKWHDFPRGSYASALGLPQFLPSNYLILTRDWDGDGQVDLWNSVEDILGSMSKYYRYHRWKPQDPVGFKAKVPKRKERRVRRKFIDEAPSRFKPWVRAIELRNYGVKLPRQVKDEQKVAFFHFDCPDSPEESFYWVGLDNFYTITRYNHSSYYAMAVYELARKIVERKEQSQKMPF